MGVLNELSSKLIKPVFTGEGYNALNTAFLALGFLLLVENYWKFAKKFDQKKLREAIIPWVLFGALLRFLDSKAWEHSAVTVTPLVWLLVLGLFTLSLSLGLRFARNLGALLALALFLRALPFIDFQKLLETLPFLILVLSFLFFLKRLKLRHSFIWAPHIFEAFVSSYAVSLGFYEEHVVARAIMSLNPWLFALIKMIIAVLVSKAVPDDEEGEFIATVLGILGLGPGLRNYLELVSK